MAKTTRHLLYYASSIDGVAQPYLAARRDDWPLGTRAPVIFLLHETLEDASPAGFIEYAFRAVADWDDALASAPPALLVLPYGRGNGGWLGLGARDVFEVWEHCRRQFLCDDRAASLVGVGAGGTGAIQLAGWHPDQFASIAVIGASANARGSLPIDASGWPAWERRQRQAVEPLSLLENLRHLPVHVEHPWWHFGVNGTAGADDYRLLWSRIEELGIAARSTTDGNGVVRRPRCPANPASLLAWVQSHQRPARPHSIDITIRSLRAATCDWISVGRLIHENRLAHVLAEERPGELAVKCQNIAALAVHIVGNDIRKLQIDRRRIAWNICSQDAAGWLRLERVGRRWELADEQLHAAAWPWPSTTSSNAFGQRPQSSPLPIKCPELGGPAMDLRWGNVMFVPGTLGDDVENRLMAALADHMRYRWQAGDDSINTHPGDRAIAVHYPIRADVDVSDDDMRSHHLVLIGNPATNLLLARYRACVACRWPDESSKGGVRLAGRPRRSTAAESVLFMICPNPDRPGRYFLIVTSRHLPALAAAGRVDTAFLPDFLILEGNRVVDWGYFAADWSTPRS